MRNAIIILLLLVSPLSAAYRAANYDGSLSSGVPGSRTGCVLGYASASTVTISPGTANHASGSYTVATTITLDITSDLDTGSEANSTWYYCYLTSATAGEISATAPTVAGGGMHPSDTSKVYVGCFRNEADGDIMQFTYYGRQSKINQGFSGTTLSDASNSWVDFNASFSCPPNSLCEFQVAAARTSNTAWTRIAFRKKGNTEQDYYLGYDTNSENNQFLLHQRVICGVDENSTLQYNRASSSVSFDFSPLGFIDRWLP